MTKTREEIVQEMFGVDYALLNEEQQEEFWDKLSDIEKYDLNQQWLLENENPEHDYLVCWEPGRFGDDDVVTNYETLYDVDLAWWEFQKQARWESIEESKQWMQNPNSHTTAENVSESINSFNAEYDNGYSMYLTGDWYRLIENGKMLYSQFISLKWYLFHEVESLFDDMEDESIPYEFADDDVLSSLNKPNDGEGSQYNANGREKELFQFKQKIFEYQRHRIFDRIDFILEKNSEKLSGKTFRTDRSYDRDDKNEFDPFTDFIFFDETALKNVKTKQFLKTFTENQIDFSECLLILNELKEICKYDYLEIYNENRLVFIDQTSK